MKYSSSGEVFAFHFAKYNIYIISQTDIVSKDSVDLAAKVLLGWTIIFNDFLVNSCFNRHTYEFLDYFYPIKN